MIDEIELFKHFKNPAESSKEHRIRIQKLQKDDRHAALFITSMQASGKTYAESQEFARSPDAIFLTQSIDKVTELMEVVNKNHPGLEYKVIKGLEDICQTYIDNQSIHTYVKELWNIGLYSKDIHRIICDHERCKFLTQVTSYDGRIIQTLKRFEVQVTLGNLYHGLHEGRLIMVDESDGLLDYEPVDMPRLPYQSERLYHSSPYLPEIYLLNAPEGTLKTLMEHYKQLIKDVDGNKEEIRNTTQLIRLVTQGFYAVENGRIMELPPVFFIFRKVLEQRMKLVVGSASLRNNRINFNTMQEFFRFAYEKVMADHETKDVTNIEKEQDEEKLSKKKIRFANKMDYLGNLKPELLEFEADYIPGFTDIYVFQSHKHSYSKSHYKVAFKGNNEELRDERWKELRKEIITALRFYELQSGKKPEKILLITFVEVEKEINRRIKKLKKSRNLTHDDLLRRISSILPLFSNRMHGINANKLGFDLIITVGDPLDARTAEFATETGIIKLNRKGFTLKKEADASLKNAVLRTMLTELLEAFHRGRSEIPIIALCNFLTPEDDDQFAGVKQVLSNENFTLINVHSKLWHMINDVKKHKGNWKENQVFLRSLIEEIKFDLSEKW